MALGIHRVKIFWAVLVTFLLLAPSFILAQEAAPPMQPPPIMTPGQTFSRMIPMLTIVFMIFYLMVIRPQDKKARAQRDLLKGLKKGQQVVTSGGIFGRVSEVGKDYVLLEIANNVKVKVEPQHVVRGYEKKAEEAAA